MRRNCRVDDNQVKIVAGLRKVGCTVLIISQLKNCFDILVGFRGINIAFEIKDGDKPLSQRKLTEGEQKFFDTWQGQVTVVESLEEAIRKVYKISGE